jgi:hypothetical protein
MIGHNAFVQSSLKEAALPNGCEIGLYAFGQCTALIKVTIGSDCGRIKYGVFQGCAALTIVTIGVQLVWTLRLRRLLAPGLREPAVGDSGDR